MPTDPVWFFSAGGHATPANFAGRVGAFLAELSYQLVGYAAYLIPAFMVVAGWHYFWCRTLDAAGTKADRRRAALLVQQRVPEPRRRQGGRLGAVVPRRRVPRGMARARLVGLPEPDRVGHRGPDRRLPLDHRVHAFFVRPPLRGRHGGARDLGAHTLRSFREWREERRRQQQRRDVIAKHTKKGAPPDLLSVGSADLPLKMAQKAGRRRRRPRAASSRVRRRGSRSLRPSRPR